MEKNILVLQHVRWEGPGRLMLRAAEQLQARLHIVRIWEESPPDIGNYDGLILLGGPPNVHEEEQYPFLREEKQLIGNWLAGDRPCLGFCLGHQLLADAFGGQIGPNFMASVGFVEGHLTHEGRAHPLFAGMTTPLTLFKWHGQSVQTPVPHNFNLLATSSHCVVEAFSIKGRPHIIGLQCDNHAADPKDVAVWLQEDMSWLQTVRPDLVSGSVLLQRAEKYCREIEDDFSILLQNFLQMVQTVTS
jgi:GMP synthase-like glutamine amidotransferase